MASATLAGGHWPAGTKVNIYRRTGEFFAAGDVVKSFKSDGGEKTLSLDDGRYWAAGEVFDANVVVSFTAKDTDAPRKRTPAPTQADPQLTPTASPSVEIVTGAKGTKIAGRLVEVPVPAGVEPHPHINQASVPGSTPQRSSTAVGQGTPTDPNEPQPYPDQRDVKKNVRQMSDTELGQATPIVSEAGPESQDDVSKRTRQRSDTEEGEATPLGSAEPRGTASNPDSRDAAAGVRRTDTKAGAKRGARKGSTAAGKVKAPPKKGRPA